eukprot:1404723-Prymnesium_polylepis.1
MSLNTSHQRRSPRCRSSTQYTVGLECGLKWYLCLHDVLLRQTPRGGRRGSHLLDERFDGAGVM